MNWLFVLLACAEPTPPPTLTPPPAVTPPPVAADAGPSLYELPVRLTAQDGRELGPDLWRGHPVMVSMFYANCRSACPLLMSKISSLEEELSPEQREEMRVLLVSFDAKNDSVEALASTASMHQVDTRRWALARTDEVRAFAAALGIRYSPTQDGGFSHTSPILLLDGEGHVVARLEQLGDDPALFLDAARRLASPR